LGDAVRNAQTLRRARVADKGNITMNKIIVALVAAGAVGCLAAPAIAADRVSGALIGGSAGAVVAGPPGAIVGGVIGAVVGGPRFYHHHRVHMDGQRRYYWDQHQRHYY
jgi:hypothetical protein